MSRATVMTPPNPGPHTAGPRAFIPALQSLRGLAALWVVLYHIDVALALAGAPPMGVEGIRVGWLGVDLFFVLSAYLLGQPFLTGRPPPGRRFLTERFLRIAPAYYAAVVAAAAMILVFYPDRWRPWPSLYNLVFLNNTTINGVYSLNPAFWSLAVEMQFYILLPFLARLFTGRRWPWGLALCLLASLAFRAAAFSGNVSNPLFFLSIFGLPSFLGHFAIGLTAARLRTVRLPVLSAAAGALLIGVPTVLLIPRGSFNVGFDTFASHILVRPLAAAGFALLVLAAATPGPVRRALEVAPLKVLGDMSYSLYLIHIPAQLVVQWAVGLPQHPALYAALAAAASLVYGAMFYGLVERPAEQWRHRRRQRAAAGKATTAGGA